MNVIIAHYKNDKHRVALMLRKFFELFNEKESNRYLYVPFKQEEMSEEFVTNVKEFKKHSESIHKNKSFTILYAGECHLSVLSPYSKVYVLGHGIDLSPDKTWNAVLQDPSLPYHQLKHLPFTDWAYAVAGGKKAISIDMIAKRMIEDGLSDAKHINVKLWFCDVNAKAYAISKRFVEHFIKYKNELRVDYYLNHFLYTPTIRDKEMHKWAKSKTTNEVIRASQIRQSLFCSQKFPKLSSETTLQHRSIKKV